MAEDWWNLMQECRCEDEARSGTLRGTMGASPDLGRTSPPHAYGPTAWKDYTFLILRNDEVKRLLVG